MNATQPNRGVIYVAIGAQFVEETRISVLSLKRHHPDLPVTLFTDQPVEAVPPFDQVVTVRQSGPRPHRDKLVWMPQSPYDETLYLDTDTYVCDNISELFDLLGRFPIAMTHDRGYVDDFPAGCDCPDPFRELNTGVVVYRQCDSIRELFADSLEWYDRLSREPNQIYLDQPAFRVALYHSNIRVATLTAEYNCRFQSFGQAAGSVKILHGRAPLAEYSAETFEHVASVLNATLVPRVLVAGKLFALGKTSGWSTSEYQLISVGGLFPSPWKFLCLRAWQLLGRHGFAPAHIWRRIRSRLSR